MESHSRKIMRGLPQIRALRIISVEQINERSSHYLSWVKYIAQLQGMVVAHHFDVLVTHLSPLIQLWHFVFEHCTRHMRVCLHPHAQQVPVISVVLLVGGGILYLVTWASSAKSFDCEEKSHLFRWCCIAGGETWISSKLEQCFYSFGNNMLTLTQSKFFHISTTHAFFSKLHIFSSHFLVIGFEIYTVSKTH